MKFQILPKLVLVLTLLSVFSAQSSALASEVRLTTDVESSLSRPDAHFSKNMWIFTKPDESGISQVYYQWVDASTTSDAISETVQLTHNTVNASDAKFGADVQALGYAETSGATSTDCNGTLFFYLADVNADSKTELRMGCIQSSSLMTSTPDILFDIAITGYNGRTNFNVKSYDVARTAVATTTIIYSASNRVDSYPVVFTDTANRLHMMMFSKDQIYGDNTNVVPPTPVMVYDFSDSFGLYTWDSATINATNRYFTPKLDRWANNIIYSFKPGTGLKKQLGTISITGSRQFQLTNFSREVLNPSYHGSYYPSSSTTNRLGIHVFFELAATSSLPSQIGYLTVGYSSSGTSAWCNTAGILTDTSADRSSLQTSYGSDTSSSTKTLMLYEREAADGNRDAYLAQVNLEVTGTDYYCNGTLTRSDGTTIEIDPSLSVVSKTYDLTSSVSSERQLTCMNDNSSPAFLPSIYHDTDFNEATSAEYGLDVILHRDLSDGSGDVLAHVYASDEATDECADTCYETSDGTAIVDTNGVTDGDGIADSCESTECSDIIHTDFYGDADSDGVINHLDNCPCDSNPDQADSDVDGWGDACDIEEDECGTTDTDSDGTFDTCDQCPNDADYTTLAYDIDGDGVNDSCVPDPSDCGTVDADSDGIFDGCDSCVNGYVPGSGARAKVGAIESATVGIACEEEPVDVDECGTTDGDGDGTFDNCDACPNDSSLTVLAYDLDGDGDNDSCAPDVNDCGEEDSDGDGVYNACDACPNDASTSTLAFDVDGDGLNDSCVAAKTSTLQTKSSETIDFDGGFLASGGIISCSLDPKATASSSTQALPLAGLGLALLGLFAQRRKKQHATESQN